MKSALKISEIHKQVASCSFPIIIGTETSWDASINSEEVFGNQYNVFRDDRDKLLSDKKSGGGVLIAVCNDLNAEEIKSSKYKEFDHVWVKTTIAKQVHIFVAVYFPPEFAKKSPMKSFLMLWTILLCSLSLKQIFTFTVISISEQLVLLLMTKMNCFWYLLWARMKRFTLYLTKARLLDQINHVRNLNNCCLDLLFTNMSDNFCVSESLAPLWKNETFHTAIEYSIFVHDNAKVLDNELSEPYYDFKHANYELIKSKLNSIDWQTMIRSVDIDHAVINFYQILYTILESSVPRKQRRKPITSKTPTWLSKKNINLKNKKLKAHKAYKRKRNDYNLSLYLSICDQLNTEIKTAYDEYNAKVENNIKSDPKSFFAFAKDKRKSNNFPSKMMLENKIGKTNIEISNLFAEFFQDVYTTHDEKDRDYQFFSYLPHPLRDVTVDNIAFNDILSSLETLDASKGAGPDGLPPVFLKAVSKELSKPLFWLFNSSLKSCTIPSIWKESFLIPIFKSGKKSDVKNYRGIALLSCIPKLFESIINQNIFSQVKNLISTNQHGFFKGRSTATNLLNFVTFTMDAMDRGNSVEVLYTDFSKAFDRVDIPLLLFKLSKIGFNSKLLKWVQSYLTGRTQKVRFEGSLSSAVNVTSGVPQGSHLGPLLFILFVNDVEYILKVLHVLIYADDMKLFLEIRNQSDLEVFQLEVDNFHIWCYKSLLDLNVKKCNSISFTRKHTGGQEVINIGLNTVQRCNHVRDLGVLLDFKLTFVDHYNHMIHKANNMLGFIKRFSLHFKDPYTIKSLYVAYVRPFLEYCCIVWSPYHETHISRIESVQKQFLLYALRKLGWTTLPLPSYESRCMLINLEGLKKRREFAMIAFINDVIAQRMNSPEILEN